MNDQSCGKLRSHQKISLQNEIDVEVRCVDVQVEIVAHIDFSDESDARLLHAAAVIELVRRLDNEQFLITDVQSRIFIFDLWL